MAERVFNPRQKKAIEHERGPMLVVAGAGTGKTSVLVERAARLVERKLAKPNEVVVLTYTLDAAAELRARLASRLKSESKGRLRALNFHSYCYDLLQSHGRVFDVLEDVDLRVFLRQRLSDLPLNIFRKAADPGRFLSNLTDFYSRCQDELVSAQHYADYVAEVKADRAPLPRVSSSKDHVELGREEIIARCEEIAAVYRKVEAMLAADNLGTFGMQITRAVELLRADASALAAERAKARFILVDEFQDSNQALIELVRLLAGEEQNVFAVGDPDQAIYRFRGASAAAFDSFRRAFPATNEVALAENYRSLSPVLEIAYRVIQGNQIVPGASQMSLVREPLRSARSEAAAKGSAPAASPVAIVSHSGDEHEAFEVVEEIIARHDAGGIAWRDFCVLYRQKDHRDDLVPLLREREVPFVVEGLDALETTEVRDLLAALRAAVWPAESASLLRFAAFPEFGVEAEKLREHLGAAKRDTPLVALLDLSAGGKKVLAAIAEVNRAAPPKETTPLAFAEHVAKRFALDRRSPALRVFFDFIEKWQTKPLAERGDITEFLEYLESYRDFGGMVPLEAAAEEDAVRLMTVHAAKGREFPHVYVIRASSGSFPTHFREPLFEFPPGLRADAEVAQREPKDLHAEEERRLFYVAMTRAKDSLTLLGCRRGKDPYPAGYLREIAGGGPGAWSSRAARVFTVDLAAAAAAMPEMSVVSPWLALPVRAAVREMPLSASAIEAYETCPLKFKIRYDWRLPEEPSGALLYGSVMHGVLKSFFEQVKAGNPPPDEAVLGQFRGELAAAKFSDELKRTLYERDGVRQLTDFLAAWRAQPQPPEVLSTERNFRVQIGAVTVTGRIDRIDRCADGAIAILDYKTGKPKEEKDAERSLQLSIYALAAPLEFQLTPSRLVFYNLVTNEAVAVGRTPVQLARAVDRVREVSENIRAGNFAPETGYHCKWCGYVDLCPATEEKLVKIEKRVTAGGVN